MSANDTTIDTADRQILASCVQSLTNDFAERVERPVRMRLGVAPPPITEFLQVLQGLQRTLQSTTEEQRAAPTFELPSDHAGVIKAAVIHKLRVMSESHGERAQRTPDSATKSQLDHELRPYLDLADRPWVQEVKVARPPRLSDYLVISEIDGWFSGAYDFAPREFDEKFGILTAPGLFLDDLAFYRFHCGEVRSRDVTVGYIDIDEFKSFNTEFTEPTVDREILPRFMRVLESAVFGHGHAYRFGGDEYVVLLPNRGRDEAVDLFARLGEELEATDYGEIKRRPTISVGICVVSHTSALTDRQVEGFAALAKSFAKEHGRNRIAGYSESPPSKEALVILHS